jgi:cell division protein FtsZ
MPISLKAPQLKELKPRIVVCGVGGAGGNAINNMIVSGLSGVDFVVANTDAQALASSRAQRIIQMGLQVTEGLGAGSKPEIGKAAAEETLEEIRDCLAGSNMVFLAAGMGGGTGTGAAPVIAAAAREMGILTVGVVTKPFHFESGRRMRVAEAGIAELRKAVDTLIIIPNQNLFRVAGERTTFADAFAMADQVLCSGISCITDLMVKEKLINLDFADVCSIMSQMGTAMIGTGEATGERRALRAAEGAIANPLFVDASLKGARGLLISITGGKDLTLYEVDEAASRIREEVDEEANIIVGAIIEPALEQAMRVSVVATGIDQSAIFRMEQMSAQSLATEPALHPSVAPPSPDKTARAPFSTVESHPSIAAGTEFEPPPLPSPVIPFPDPTGRRRILDEETHFNPPAIRRLLKRFSVAASERRHARRASA